MKTRELTNEQKQTIANLRHVANMMSTALSFINDENALRMCNPQSVDFMRQCALKAKNAAVNELGVFGDKYSKLNSG